MKGLPVDLVIINEQGPSYGQDLQGTLESLVRTSEVIVKREPPAGEGGIFILRGDLLSDADRDLLRTAARASVKGIEETSVRALVKLEQVLPSHLRRRVRALGTATSAIAPGGPEVDAQSLSVLAAACRDSERVRFGYRGRDGANSRREVEPHSLVNVGRRWYLVAWDRSREDWRTFRVDRLSAPAPRRTRRCSCCTSTTGHCSTAQHCAPSAIQKTHPCRRAAKFSATSKAIPPDFSSLNQMRAFSIPRWRKDPASPGKIR